MNAIQAMVKQMEMRYVPPADRRQHVFELARKGLSQRAIAFEVGISRTAVFNILRSGRQIKGVQ